MFASFNPTPPGPDLAERALRDEAAHRFGSFTANDAVTLGLSLRKRFRSTHATSRGIVITVQTIAGHTLFSCTVGDLAPTMPEVVSSYYSSGQTTSAPGSVTGKGKAGSIGVGGDVTLDSWSTVQLMVDSVKRTSHSSLFVHHASATQMPGGAFPIWLTNAPCCPIAVVACFSGDSVEDHNLVVSTVRDYIAKMRTQAEGREPQAASASALPVPSEFGGESLYASNLN